MNRALLILLAGAGALAAAEITPERLLQAQSDPNTWLMYSKN